MDEMRTFLLMCGRTATTYEPTAGWTLEETQVITAERDRFCSYVSTVRPQELQHVQPLPYERVLTERESNRLWGRLERRWGADRHGFWYPLNQILAPPPQTVAFNEAWFALYLPPPRLRQILARRGVTRIWQLSTEGEEYEMELALLFADGRQSEGYWMTDKMDWIIYQSHEASLTIAGERLLTPIKKAWPQWNEHLYTGWWNATRPSEEERQCVAEGATSLEKGDND